MQHVANSFPERERERWERKARTGCRVPPIHKNLSAKEMGVRNKGHDVWYLEIFKKKVNEEEKKREAYCCNLCNNGENNKWKTKENTQNLCNSAVCLRSTKTMTQVLLLYFKRLQSRIYIINTKKIKIPEYLLPTEYCMVLCLSRPFPLYIYMTHISQHILINVKCIFLVKFLGIKQPSPWTS